MAAINKHISYKGRKQPTGKGLAQYLGSDRRNREKVLLVDGKGRETTASMLGSTMEKPLDQAGEGLHEYTEWAKREGVDFRRDRSGNLALRGADGRETVVDEVKNDVDSSAPDIEKLTEYLTKDKSTRERQMLVDADGRLLSPRDAAAKVRNAQANYWHAITAPSEIGCAALMERYHTKDSVVAALEHGKLMSERIAKLTHGEPPSFAIHWDSATKWHYHWVGIGDPKTILAGANGAIQKAWDIEFEEKFDRGRVKNWKAYREYEAAKKENVALNRVIREFENEKFHALRGLEGEAKGEAKNKFDQKEAELIEQRYRGEIREADLQYRAFGSQGGSRHLAALEQAELTRRSAVKRLVERDLSYFDRSKAAEKRNKDRQVQKREEHDAERSASGKRLQKERSAKARIELDSYKTESEAHSVDAELPDLDFDSAEVQISIVSDQDKEVDSEFTEQDDRASELATEESRHREGIETLVRRTQGQQGIAALEMELETSLGDAETQFESEPEILRKSKARIRREHENRKRAFLEGTLEERTELFAQAVQALSELHEFERGNSEPGEELNGKMSNESAELEAVGINLQIEMLRYEEQDVFNLVVGTKQIESLRAKRNADLELAKATISSRAEAESLTPKEAKEALWREQKRIRREFELAKRELFGGLPGLETLEAAVNRRADMEARSKQLKAKSEGRDWNPGKQNRALLAKANTRRKFMRLEIEQAIATEIATDFAWNEGKQARREASNMEVEAAGERANERWSDLSEALKSPEIQAAIEGRTEGEVGNAVRRAKTISRLAALREERLHFESMKDKWPQAIADALKAQAERHKLDLEQKKSDATRIAAGIKSKLDRLAEVIWTDEKEERVRIEQAAERLQVQAIEFSQAAKLVRNHFSLSLSEQTSEEALLAHEVFTSEAFVELATTFDQRLSQSEGPERDLALREFRLREQQLGIESKRESRRIRAERVPDWEALAQELKAIQGLEARAALAQLGDPEVVAERFADLERRHADQRANLDAAQMRWEAKNLRDVYDVSLLEQTSREDLIVSELKSLEAQANLKADFEDRLSQPEGIERDLTLREYRLKEQQLRSESGHEGRRIRGERAPDWTVISQELLEVQALEAKAAAAQPGDPEVVAERLADLERRHADQRANLETSQLRWEAQALRDEAESHLAPFRDSDLKRETSLYYEEVAIHRSGYSEKKSQRAMQKVREKARRGEWKDRQENAKDRSNAFREAVEALSKAHDLERSILLAAQLEAPEFEERRAEQSNRHQNQIDAIEIESLRDSVEHDLLALEFGQAWERPNPREMFQALDARHKFELASLERRFDLQGVSVDAPERIEARKELTDRQVAEGVRLESNIERIEGRKSPRKDLDLLSLVEKAKREALRSQERTEEYSTHGRDQVELDAAPVDNIVSGAAKDILKGDSGKLAANAADRTVSAIAQTGNREMDSESAAGTEAARTLKDVAKDLQNENLVSAATRAATGTARIAGTANRHVQELTDDIGKAFDLITKPFNAVRNVAKDLDFEL